MTISPPFFTLGIQAKPAVRRSPKCYWVTITQAVICPIQFMRVLTAYRHRMNTTCRRGFTYLYFKGVPLYAFGHGLTYTQFKYSNMKLSQNRTNTTGEVEVSFDLQNSGSRAGAEVAQMYVHQVKTNVIQPIKSLRGFQRVMLEPGEIKHVTMARTSLLLSRGYST